MVAVLWSATIAVSCSNKLRNIDADQISDAPTQVLMDMDAAQTEIEQDNGGDGDGDHEGALLSNGRRFSGCRPQGVPCRLRAVGKASGKPRSQQRRSGSDAAVCALLYAAQEAPAAIFRRSIICQRLSKGKEHTGGISPAAHAG